MTDYELFTLLIGVSGVLVATIAAFIGVRNLKLLVKSHADNHEWNRRIATQDALGKLRELNIDDLNREFGYADQLSAIPLATVLEKFEANPDLQISCHRLLNFYEGIASGINLGIFDELTVKVNRRGPMERDFAKFREYIAYRRDQVSKTIYIEQEKVTTKWREELLIQSSRAATGLIQ